MVSNRMPLPLLCLLVLAASVPAAAHNGAVAIAVPVEGITVDEPQADDMTCVVIKVVA